MPPALPGEVDRAGSRSGGCLGAPGRWPCMGATLRVQLCSPPALTFRGNTRNPGKAPSLAVYRAAARQSHRPQEVQEKKLSKCNRELAPSQGRTPACGPHVLGRPRGLRPSRVSPPPPPGHGRALPTSQTPGCPALPTYLLCPHPLWWCECCPMTPGGHTGRQRVRMRPRSQPASTGPGGSHPRIPQAVLGLRAGPRARPLTCPMARGLDGALSRPDTTGGKTPCALFCKRGKRAQGLPLKWKGTPRPVHVSRQGEKFPGGPQEPWLAPAGCSHTHNSCLRRGHLPLRPRLSSQARSHP